jgi:hypothetical protein
VHSSLTGGGGGGGGIGNGRSTGARLNKVYNFVGILKTFIMIKVLASYQVCIRTR